MVLEHPPTGSGALGRGLGQCDEDSISGVQTATTREGSVIRSARNLRGAPIVTPWT